MTYGTVLGVLFIHLGFMLSTLAYWLASRALFPRLVEWSDRRVSESPVRNFFAGALVGVPVFILGVALTKNPVVPGLLQLGAGILLLLLLCALAGSAGLAQRVGRGLGRAGDAAEPWRPLLRGGVVVVFLFIAPILGWFVLIPWVLISGLGATLSYARTGRRAIAGEVAV